MAIVVESTASRGFVASNTVVITKPTGLTEGDLMVAFISVIGDTTQPTITTPSGWSTIIAMGETGANNVGRAAYYKIATSTDAAATDFTFTASFGTDMAGGMYRITGFDSTNPIFASTDVEPATTSTQGSATISLTPQVADSLFIAGIFTGGELTYTTYSTTPSFTLTQAYQHNESVPTGSTGSVYGVYSGSAEITNFTFNFTGTAGADTVIGLLLTPQVNASADISHLAITPTVESVTGSNTATATIDHLSIEPTLEPVRGSDNMPYTDWTTTPKS